MAHAKFLGISDPEKAFDALAPLRAELLKMEGRIRPNSSDYLVMCSVRRALETAAHHFTREPNFYMRNYKGHTA